MRLAGSDKQPEEMMRVISDPLNQGLHVLFVAEVEIGTLPASKMVGIKGQTFVPYLQPARRRYGTEHLTAHYLQAEKSFLLGALEY